MSDGTPWYARVRNARRGLGLSQAALGRLTGLSPETIRAYENARRHPGRVHLEAIVDALGLPPHDGNAILVEAGYAARAALFPPAQFPGFYFQPEELQPYIDQRPWPDFVLNQALELMAANRAAQALWQIDLAHELTTRTRAQLNMLSVASDHHFADRVTNWPEVIGVIIAVFKGQPRLPESSLDEPSAYFGEVLAEFARGDPAFLPALATLWDQVPPREAKVNWTYPVRWCDPEFGEMRFLAQVSTANGVDGFAFNSWIPVDAETWMVLERVTARHRAERGCKNDRSRNS
jgi:transcriptional regulator with XRE-family HTH domain